MARSPVNQSERTADMRWRMSRLERHVIGTEEANWQDGLVVWRTNIDRNFARVRKTIHLWGGALLTVLFGTGMINQNAAHVIGAFIRGLLGAGP